CAIGGVVYPGEKGARAVPIEPEDQRAVRGTPWAIVANQPGPRRHGGARGYTAGVVLVEHPVHRTPGRASHVERKRVVRGQRVDVPAVEIKRAGLPGGGHIGQRDGSWK